jgi:hypothetical protein
LNSGEHTPLACLFRRLAETDASASHSEAATEKVRERQTRSPARETRTLRGIAADTAAAAANVAAERR